MNTRNLPRIALLSACAAVAWSAHALATRATATVVDADLATLLVGMALIKGLLVAAAIGATWWRFGWPVDARRAFAYGLGLATMTGATVLIAHLAWIGAAAIAFHAGALVVMVTAWRDDGLARRGMAGETRRVARPILRRSTPPSIQPSGTVPHAG